MFSTQALHLSPCSSRRKMNNTAITSDYRVFSQSNDVNSSRLDYNERLSISRGSFCPTCSRRWVVGSTFIFLFSIFFTGSLWLTLSSTTTQKIQMHRIYSRLLSVNYFFVSRIQVTNTLGNEGPIVYSFSKVPELSKEIELREKFDVVISGNAYQAWDFWMNEGSSVEIKYNISDTEMDLFLVVIQGEQNMHDWIRDPTSAKSLTSWRIAQGADVPQYRSESNQNYYFTFVNSRSSAIQGLISYIMFATTCSSNCTHFVSPSCSQVNFDLLFHIKVHDTTGSKSQCFATDKPCSIPLNFLTPDVLLLISPQTQQKLEGSGYGHMKHTDASIVQRNDGLWTIDITFEQRLVAYLIFWGATLAILLLLLAFCSCASSSCYDQTSTVAIDRTRLDTLYEEEKAKLQNVDEESSDLEDYMCLICFETRRSCFFEPCGHSTACISCSMRISKETRPRCPLCRQQIQIVRKLFLQ